MQAAFLDCFNASVPHGYRMQDLGDGRDALHKVGAVFPQAEHCRHCGGRDNACTKGLEARNYVS